jgi:hypothetical protein
MNDLEHMSRDLTMRVLSLSMYQSNHRILMEELKKVTKYLKIFLEQNNRTSRIYFQNGANITLNDKSYKEVIVFRNSHPCNTTLCYTQFQYLCDFVIRRVTGNWYVMNNI